MTDQDATPKRSTFRHGDLRRALLEAGLDLAREGGPDAVILREATRRAGVVPNAAYRHYASREALLQAVRQACVAALARSIEKELATIDPNAPLVARAKAHLRGVGMGYIKFAILEPGLLRTAFAIPDGLKGQPAPEKSGDSGKTPFQLLSDAIDLMLEAGLLPKSKRLGAEFLAWSSVYGLSMLMIDGPLRSFSPAQVEAVGQRLIEMVERGLTERSEI